MSRITKWVATLATLAALWTIFAPALWAVSHQQALTNILLGEFGALAIGHTAYRIASGKQATPWVAVAGGLCGAALAASPIFFGLVTGFTSSNMIGGGLIALVGFVTAALALLSGEEQHVPDLGSETETADEGAGIA